MKRFYTRVPERVWFGAALFVCLLLGGYFVGSSGAASTKPTYITDSSGTNSVSVNKKGHLSVHIADPTLPVGTGPEGAGRIAFPPVSGLSTGQCYEAFVRSPGSFLSAALTDHPGTGGGSPDVLIRLDRDVVWLEDKTGQGSPVGGSTGVVRSAHSWDFGFGYALDFKLFAGVDVCWHGPGTSDAFAVQLTIAAFRGQVVYPEVVSFNTTGSGPGRSAVWTHHWVREPGPTPVGFTIMGTSSDEVSFYHKLAKQVPYVASESSYSAPITGSDPRYFLFERQVSGDPTRVGPFGSWAGL